ncbi:rootletin-like isoform X2 [Homarus americanus]|uniref:rootletin-like isoform X2 n=1 Tax=Homarus americanus TaxID=6706 RepID=UPI001C486B71|nr:rootletin-like isoform X2 [Homarus americanus]
MLGESVVVSGAGGTTLLRPRSADNLIRLAPATSLPALDDLAESEVFVGDEDEDVGFSHELRQVEEVNLRPSTMDQMLSHGSSSSGNNCDATSSDLLSPTGPTPTANLLITYHDEALRLPLDAVKEEVEAEALEEASMIMSSGPGSLSHVSLTSSVISNNSLDDSTLSSRTDTFDTVVAVPFSDSSSPPDVSNASSPTPTKTTPTRPSNRDATRVSGTPTRTSPTSPRGSSGRSSPRTSTDSPRTPERRRKSATSSPRSDNSRGSTPRATAMRTTPRGVDKTKGEDKKTPRGSGRSGSTTAERKHCARMQDSTFKRDSDKTYGHTRIKDHTEDSKSSFFGRKKKPDAKDNNQDTDSKFNTIGRKKKENKSEKEEVAEKYGTLGRRRKTKESGDTKDDCKDKLSKDTKNTLDMYATLPRRKAREMSARWREQMAAEEEAARPSLRRTKSVGKSETSSSVTRGRASVMTSSMPSSSLTGLGRSRSPRTIHREAKSTSTTFNARKERTIICMETGVQTSLTGGDLVSALRALSRQNSVGTEEDPEDAAETRPHVSIIREMKTPEDLPDRRHVEVQVELAWRLGDGELPEHVRRLTEEHTRLQTEHSRARSRLEEMEGIREEMEKMKARLEEERLEKEEVQGELDRTSQRVKDMLISMEGVEHEFNSRGDSLMELESQLHHSADIHVQMQERLNQYEEFALKYKRDLDKSVAAQKTLLQQVQDLENDGREMADFMAEEKNALAECLREAETELVKLRSECKRLSAKIKEKDDEARQMIRNKYMILQSEMNSMQSRTRDMMVCQGAEVSGAAVALANLSSRLNTLIGKLVQDYSITETDLEMIVTPNESDSSASSTNGTPEHKSPYKISVRSPSPRKTASFITALINAMRLGPKGKLNQSGGLLPCNGKKQETEGRNSPEGSESHEVVEHDGNSGPSSSSSVSLTDQVTDVDILLTQFLKVCCVLKNDTDNRLMEIEDENDRLCNQIRSQQQVIDQQQADYENLNRSESRAKRELMVASRDLEIANQSLNKFYQADYELQVKKLQDEVERLGATIRHLEVLHTEKEKQLEESLSSLSAAQGPAPPNHVSEATHQQEIATLNDKVTSLRQSVIERDRRVNELSERHSQDLATVRECQIEAHRSNRRLTTTVDHVLKTMESIPDIVSSNTTLKQLFATLAAAEKSNQQQQNGNINTQNGFGNTVNNKDLNANPQSIIDSGINNQKILTSIKAETHL